ncbi:MAG: ABC transporter substrate-binding protein [Phycisphaerae bacterium]|nr:ABC transporter substrate-binding protein [Phycisphaerae bacterium]
MKFQISNFKFQKLTAAWAIPALFLFTVFCGCSKKSVPTKPTNVENSRMRIVSMAPNLTEILFGLGLDEEIAGVTKYSTYPPQAQEKTCVGTFWQPDVEAVLALGPTLMVNLWFDQQAALVSRMERIGCETLTLRIENIDQLYQAIVEIGKAVNKQPQAQLMVERLQGKQSEIIARYAGREKPKVLWVIQRYPFRVAGRDTFVNELIEMAGGVNAIGPTLTQYPPINTEEVIGSLPDVIIEPVMDAEQFEEQKKSAEEFYHRYAIVPAVRNGKIHIIDGDLVSRLGPRLDEAAELVAGCLWQE